MPKRNFLWKYVEGRKGVKIDEKHFPLTEEILFHFSFCFIWFCCLSPNFIFFRCCDIFSVLTPILHSFLCGVAFSVLSLIFYSIPCVAVFPHPWIHWESVLCPCFQIIWISFYFFHKEFLAFSFNSSFSSKFYFINFFLNFDWVYLDWFLIAHYCNKASSLIFYISFLSFLFIRLIFIIKIFSYIGCFSSISWKNVVLTFLYDFVVYGCDPNGFTYIFLLKKTPHKKV